MWERPFAPSIRQEGGLMQGCCLSFALAGVALGLLTGTTPFRAIAQWEIGL